jgi:hypothetical protein
VRPWLGRMAMSVSFPSPVPESLAYASTTS